MAGSCLLRSSSPGAITTSQFLESFQRVWLESRAPRAERRRETRLPRRIGLAVSGGADSMALAYLCRQWEKTNRRDDVAVTAFVVDHKARVESAREAATVTRWLTELGITTQVLELSWSQGPQSQTPSQVSAFETHARRLRFQALGTACRDRQIEALLMGHHQDDNVETTLWRLCSGARGPGLAGIPSVNPIPECHGLFGVAESGSSVTLQGVYSGSYQGDAKGDKDDKGFGSRRIPMSTGGIFICRPLLSFPKASLLATCHDNHVPYVSDPTNFDPTLTPRNAIRSLVSSNRLPRALQSPSVLSLVKHSQDLIRDTTALSNELLQQCKILDLNLATGTMTLQFPSSDTPSTTMSNCNLAAGKIQQIQASTLRRITDLISPFPENHFPLRSFENFTSRVLPDLRVSTNTQRQAFTLGGVMFQPVERHEASPNNHKQTDTHTHTHTYHPSPLLQNSNDRSNNDKNNTWLLSRQPFMKNRLPTIHLDVPVPYSMKHPQNQTQLSPTAEHENGYTPWTLWDDRYWFRVSVSSSGSQYTDLSESQKQKQNKSGTDVHTNTSINTQKNNQEAQATLPLIIRPLLKSDLQLIRRISDYALLESTTTTSSTSTFTSRPPKTKNHKALDCLIKRLAKEAPGQTRFTVPVVVIPQGYGGLQHDVPIGLPTMEQWVPGAQAMMRARGILDGGKVQWEWMYKMVDTEPLKLMGGLEKEDP